MHNIIYIYRTIAHALLNLVNELGKRNKREACRTFYHFFAASVINSIIQ